MTNAPIDYINDVEPLEATLNDEQIAVEINKLTVNDILTTAYRDTLSQTDALYTDATNNLFQKGSLGEAPIQDPTDWALEPTLQRDLDRLVNFLFASNKLEARTRTSQNHATQQYTTLLNFRQFRYDRSTIDEDGLPINELDRRSLDDAQINAIYDLGGGFLYGPPTDGNAATEAEVTQSRVDYNQDQTDSATRAVNLQASEDITSRGQNASNAAFDTYSTNPDPNNDISAQITLDGEAAFDAPLPPTP